jgi:hypothetical protein
MSGSRRFTNTVSGVLGVATNGWPVVTAGKVTLAAVSTDAERGSGRAGASGAASPTYFERLRVPWWWYLVGLGVASIFAAEFHVAGFDLTDWIPWGTLLPLSVFIVWSLSRTSVAVSDGELRTRGAHLPMRFVSGVVPLDPATLRRVVGREGDPASFVTIRPWVGPGVQLWLDDPDDPTPYWVVSTRHPDRLVAALRAGLTG